MTNPANFDVVVTGQNNSFNKFESIFGGAMLNATRASNPSSEFVLDGGDLIIREIFTGREVARFEGSNLSVDSMGAPMGTVTSVAFFNFVGNTTYTAAWFNGADIAVLADASDESFFNTSPSNAPEWFDALHDGVRWLQTGTDSTDLFWSYAPDDVILARRGNDTVEYAGSARRIDGGGGNKDTLDFFRYDFGVTVDLVTGVIIDGASTTVVRNFERIFGSEFDDTLTVGDESFRQKVLAGDGNDTVTGGDGVGLFGEDGEDTLTITGDGGLARGGKGRDVIVSEGDNVVRGDGGRDRIEIKGGNNTIYGGAQKDEFIFDTGVGVAPDVHVIEDYEFGEKVFFRINSGSIDVAQDGNDVRITANGENGNVVVILRDTPLVPGLDLLFDFL
ncbi:MAG: hypothetical protein AAF761_00400 [Pseudomonadota bacterium]